MMPHNVGGVPVEPERLQPRGRVQPGRDDRAQGARPRHAGGVREDGRRADHRPRPHLRQQGADRGDQRPHRASPADLGRARLQRRVAGGHGAADPPRQELQRGRALHRGPAQAARRRRQAAARAACVPALPRLDQDRLASVRAPPLAHGGHLLAARPRRHQARLALPGLGLHRGERALPVGAHALDPRPRLRRARRHEPERPQGRRRGAQVQDRQDHRLHARRAAERAPASGGARDRALLPRPAGLPARIAIPARSRRPAAAHPRQHLPGRASSATSRARPRPRTRRARRSTATGCSATRARSGPTTSSSSATRTT